MPLNAKKLAFLGLLLSITILLVIFSGILEFNTLFLLAGSSFCVGIAIREVGLRYGFGFYIASILLSFLLAPNKFYCFTFAAFGLYIVVTEAVFEKLTYVRGNKKRSTIFWIFKYVTFNIMYIPILLFLPKLIYPGPIHKVLWIVFLLIGQIVLFIYDKAYCYFQKNMWGKVRSKINL